MGEFRQPEKFMILVSACLLGINCKYNGKNNKCPAVLRLSGEVAPVPVCPEQLGGLPTPRKCAEIFGMGGKEVLEGKAKVINEEGVDVSSHFIKGAEEIVKIADILNIKKALLKARSPSCGAGQIYDGSFTGRLKEGDGVTAALLREKGFRIFTEEDLRDNGWITAQ